jgi:hypothetical protein
MHTAPIADIVPAHGHAAALQPCAEIYSSASGSKYFPISTQPLILVRSNFEYFHLM